ncbi:MAG: VOC family protein [Ekhidna sp.]|uniref:VOC family protein n=1 Tax=Ekhidna sp. TaxID=2608089 RepID=UPI0032F0779C
MNLGQFSISLPVKNMEASVDFYQKLGFEIIDGGHMNDSFPDGENTSWRIMKSESVVIGLFHGMFEESIMTFNPKDVRSIQKELKAKGIKLIKEANETTEGPEHIILTDPDGNQIMMDQH